jgi:hypothetical protein
MAEAHRKKVDDKHVVKVLMKDSFQDPFDLCLLISFSRDIMISMFNCSFIINIKGKDEETRDENKLRG